MDQVLQMKNEYVGYDFFFLIAWIYLLNLFVNKVFGKKDEHM